MLIGLYFSPLVLITLLSHHGVGKVYCIVFQKFLTVGLKVEACLMPKYIIHLKRRENLRMLFLLTLLLKALTKPEDGKYLFH